MHRHTLLDNQRVTYFCVDMGKYMYSFSLFRGDYYDEIVLNVREEIR